MKLGEHWKEKERLEEKSEKQKTRSAKSGFTKNGVFQSPLQAAGMGSTQKVKQPATATKDGRLVGLGRIIGKWDLAVVGENAADRGEASREFTIFGRDTPSSHCATPPDKEYP